MTLRAPRALAIGSEVSATQAAMAMFPRGNAVDAVVAGVFAAAAVHASVLLGPVQLLVGGTGIGLRAVDGRLRQPGLGAPRPRGFRPEDPIPAAAYVAVPALAAALSVALASFGSASLARVLASAIEQAKALSEARTAILRHIAQRGPALTDARISAELVQAAGPLAGGILTVEDLDAVLPSVEECRVDRLGPRSVATLPWGAASVRDPAVEGVLARELHVLAAVDGRGLLAVACYEAPSEGLVVEELGLVAPLAAEPVLRGQTRVPRGQLRRASAPIAIVDSGAGFDLAVGLATLETAESALGAWLRSSDLVFAEVAGGGRCVGVLRTTAGARSIGFAE